MNIKVKTGIIIFVTLLIGIILGVQADRLFLKFQFKKHVVQHKPPRRFTNVIERIVRPDEHQREQIRQVLMKHEARLAVIDSLIWTKMTVEMDSLKKNLAPILTEEQKKRLNEKLKRAQDWRKEGPPFLRPRKPPFPRRGHERMFE